MSKRARIEEEEAKLETAYVRGCLRDFPAETHSEREKGKWKWAPFLNEETHAKTNKTTISVAFLLWKEVSKFT